MERNRDTGHAGEGTIQLFVFLAAALAALVLALPLLLVGWVAAAAVLAAGVAAGGYLARRYQVIAQWENAPLMKFGKVRGFAKPGINWIPPFYRIYDRIDMRTRTDVFDSGEVQNFSLDQVPLRVNAVVFWRVENATLALTKVA